jgi:hypothetical protein
VSRTAISRGSARGDADFIESMRRLGATSPASACVDSILPSLLRQRFRDLLDRGLLREAAPGTFYLYESAVTTSAFPGPTQSKGSRGVVLRLLFWLVIILAPLLVIMLKS